MEYILTTDALTKTYKNFKALNGFSMHVPKGAIYGFVGKNGAGKTTLMRILATLSEPTTGMVEINGIDIKRKKEIRKIIGYLPQEFSIYPNMTVYSALDYLGILAELPNNIRKRRINELLKQVNLEHEKNKRFKNLSGGMKRRFGIAQALLNDPKILIIDEPTAGLDPKERIRIRNFISEIAEDKIVLISTHVVSDIEFIAKEIILLKKGQLISHDSPNKLTKELENKVFEVEIQREDLKYFQDNYRVSNLCHNDNSIIVRIVTDNPPTDCQYTTAKPTLEDLYLYIFEQGM